MSPATIEVPPARLWWQDAGDGLKPLAESPHAQAVREIMAGKAPAETEYAALCKAHPYRNDGQCGAEVLAGLIASMRADGWQGEPVDVAINDRGQIVLIDGLHRSAVALVLGISVPARVVYRHEKWLALKYALRELNGGEKLYQPIDHPDFGPWPEWRRDTEARAEVIARAIGGVLPNVADVGCNAGVLACALMRAGCEVAGFDTDERAIRAADLLFEMHGIGAGDCRDMSRFRVGSTERLARESWDAVVCLSLLNHFAAHPERSEAGLAMVRDLVRAAPLVVFDCPSLGDPVGGDTPLTDSAAMLAWFASAGVTGIGTVLAERGSELQRTLLAWRR